MLVWEAKSIAACSAVASAVKAEQFTYVRPEIVAPALFVTANVVLVNDLDPSDSARKGLIASLRPMLVFVAIF